MRSKFLEIIGIPYTVWKIKNIEGQNNMFARCIYIGVDFPGCPAVMDVHSSDSTVSMDGQKRHTT